MFHYKWSAIYDNFKIEQLSYERLHDISSPHKNKLRDDHKLYSYTTGREYRHE